MYPSGHQLQKSRRESPFREWKCSRGLLTWLWSSWIDYVVVQHFSGSVTISFLCFTTNGILAVTFLFLVLCGVSIHVFVHVRVQAKNSNGTTMRMFLNLNLLHGRCMLFPFPSALTSLCTPGSRPRHQMSTNKFSRGSWFKPKHLQGEFGKRACNHLKGQQFLLETFYCTPFKRWILILVLQQQKKMKTKRRNIGASKQTTRVNGNAAIMWA